MKKLLLAALAGLPILLSAQTFKQVATDGTGDDHSFGLDVTEVAYTLSTNMDSLYVQITHNGPRGDDFGFALALDTNLNPNDGNPINQTNIVGSPNTSMKSDILLFAYQNGFFPGLNYESYGPAGGSITLNFELDTADSFYSIFRIPLTDLGGNIDFNLIGFTGAFDISASGPSDAAPNSTFGQIRESHIGIDEHKLGVGIYPNPASGFFHLEQSGMLKIYSTQGALVKSIEAIAGKPVDCSGLASGLYHVKFNDNTSAGKLIVQ